MEDLRKVVTPSGGDPQVVMRVVERRVEVEAHEAQAFDVAPLLEKPVHGREKFADARRRGRFLTELGEQWEGGDWVVGQSPLRKKTFISQTTALASASTISMEGRVVGLCWKKSEPRGPQGPAPQL